MANSPSSPGSERPPQEQPQSRSRWYGALGAVSLAIALAIPSFGLPGGSLVWVLLGLLFLGISLARKSEESGAPVREGTLVESIASEPVEFDADLQPLGYFSPREAKRILDSLCEAEIECDALFDDGIDQKSSYAAAFGGGFGGGASVLIAVDRTRVTEAASIVDDLCGDAVPRGSESNVCSEPPIHGDRSIEDQLTTFEQRIHEKRKELEDLQRELGETITSISQKLVDVRYSPTAKESLREQKQRLDEQRMEITSTLGELSSHLERIKTERGKSG